MAISVLSLVLLFSSAVFGYDDKYSKIDVDKLIANDELFMSYLNCFIDKGPCTAEYAAEFREILPEVIKESCAKCNDVQKQKVRKIVTTVYDKKPDIAAELQTKYDPNHEYEEKFAAFLASN